MGARPTGRGARRRRRARWVSRPLPPAWSRTPVLAASGSLALGLGLLVGVGVDLLAPGAATATATAQGPPATCAEAQAAWARSASSQVRLSAEDPETLRRGFTDARDSLAEVSPPEPVAEDWSTVLDYLGAVADAVAGAEGDDEVATAVADTLAGLDTPAMTRAADRVTTYLETRCGSAADDD